MAKPIQAPASVARKQVGMKLRTAREAVGLDLKQVVAELGPGWSISKLGRLERGETGRISLPEVDAIARILEMDEDTHSNLVALVQQAASKSWWYRYRDVVQGGFRIYADMEACAEQLTMYHANIVPGLMQTAEYARALDRIYFANESEDALDRRLRLKLERQTFITRKTKPVALKAVLHESAIHTEVGGPRVMRHQIDHLVEMSKRPNISLRVVPFAAGHPLGTAIGSFTIIAMKDSGLGTPTPVVYFETLVGGAALEDDESISTHTAAMGALQRAALDEVSTRTLLRTFSKKG